MNEKERYTIRVKQNSFCEGAKKEGRVLSGRLTEAELEKWVESLGM